MGSPSFHPPMVVRVERIGSGYRLEVKRANAEELHAQAVERDTVVVPDEAEG